MRYGGVLIALVMVAAAAPADAANSELWGREGELFDPKGPLMDWSYAGYHYGEDPLPRLTPTVDVGDYGAAGDGVTDDTSAFLDAIAAVEDGGGTVHAPAGTYVISDKLTIPDGVVLQGDGPGTTTLFIPVSLTDVYGNPGLDSGGTSTYSFSQGFIEARGNVDGDPIASVVTPAERGDFAIEVDDVSGIEVGQWIRITQTDVGGELMDRLHADLQEGGEDNIGDRGMNFHTRVSEIAGTTLELERALPVDIDLGWSPDVRPVTASVTEIGVEDLTIEFPLTPYPGHFDEEGFNAIDFSEVMHSWVRNVEVLNSDYGVNIRRSYFVTVADVVLATTGDRGELVGHHGLNHGHGSDNLYIGFDIRATFIHDLTNEWYATGVVFTKGRGDDLRMDHHRAAPYTTLWTELDCGEGASPFVSGGASNRGPHTAAYDTLWNVRAAQAMQFPDDDYGPRINFIGFQTDATEVSSPFEWRFEDIEPQDLDPPNIWEAMRERRLGPEDPGTGTDTGSDTGDTAEDDDGADDTGGVDETAGGIDDGEAGPTGTISGSASGETTGSPAAGDDSGCGCRSSNPRGFAALLLLLGLAALRRRC